MIAAAWEWALGGILAFLIVGLLLMLALGALSLPGTISRRLGQAVTAERTDAGVPLPDEVPDASAAEVAEQADELRES